MRATTLATFGAVESCRKGMQIYLTNLREEGKYYVQTPFN